MLTKMMSFLQLAAEKKSNDKQIFDPSYFVRAHLKSKRTDGNPLFKEILNIKHIAEYSKSQS